MSDAEKLIEALQQVAQAQDALGSSVPGDHAQAVRRFGETMRAAVEAVREAAWFRVDREPVPALHSAYAKLEQYRQTVSDDERAQIDYVVHSSTPGTLGILDLVAKGKVAWLTLDVGDVQGRELKAACELAQLILVIEALEATPRTDVRDTVQWTLIAKAQQAAESLPRCVLRAVEGGAACGATARAPMVETGVG